MRLWKTLAAAAVLSVSAISPAFANDIGGTSGDDMLRGTSGDDTITAYGGADVVRSKAGNDLVFGGRGQDALFGGRGSDELRGGAGSDYLVDGRGWDVLIGDSDKDKLFGRGAGLWFGNDGNDHIEIAYPDGASTKVRCGAGRHDELVFNEPYDGVSIRGCETVKIIPAG